MNELDMIQPPAHARLNSRRLAQALNFDSPWVIAGIKKANRMYHEQGREELIFTGRYSTPAKINRWLDDHPEFVASHFLAPQRRRPLLPYSCHTSRPHSSANVPRSSLVPARLYADKSLLSL